MLAGSTQADRRTDRPADSYVMAALPPDYDTDPERSHAWAPPLDAHDDVGPKLAGPVLDIACGRGRLKHSMPDDVAWIGVDASPQQLSECPFRPVVRADMERLPFRDGAFASATHMWCLYHQDDPAVAVGEAKRVLRPGGRYACSTSARTDSPEVLPEGHPPSTFDAEDAPAIVSSVFGDVEVDAWDEVFFRLETRQEVRDFCRAQNIPMERAEEVDVPLPVTKRGCIVWATKR